MTEELKKKMQEMADKCASYESDGEIYKIPYIEQIYQVGFIACHDLMEKDLTEWKAQAEMLAEALDQVITGFDHEVHDSDSETIDWLGHKKDLLKAYKARGDE